MCDGICLCCERDVYFFIQIINENENENANVSRDECWNCYLEQKEILF
jgi:hypothetical protein